MPAKVREIKDDAIIEIKLNKNFYSMLKGVMLYILKIDADEAKIKDMVDKIINRDTDDKPHTEQEAAFKTMFLLIAEIENRAMEHMMLSRVRCCLYFLAGNYTSTHHRSLTSIAIIAEIIL